MNKETKKKTVLTWSANKLYHMSAEAVLWDGELTHFHVFKSGSGRVVECNDKEALEFLLDCLPELLNEIN